MERQTSNRHPFAKSLGHAGYVKEDACKTALRLGALEREELKLLKLPYVLCAVHHKSQATVQA